MVGKSIYSDLTSKRDYSGSKADEYAQLLHTLFGHIGDALFPILEKAKSSNKTLSIKNDASSSDILIDEITEESIILI